MFLVYMQGILIPGLYLGFSTTLTQNKGHPTQGALYKPAYLLTNHPT